MARASAAPTCRADLLPSQRSWRRQADRDFVRFGFHDLRHLHALEWLLSGRSIYALRQRLGHDSLKTTEVHLKYLAPEEPAGEGTLPKPAQASVTRATKTNKPLSRIVNFGPAGVHDLANRRLQPLGHVSA
jgi:hypothetical protein